MATPTQRILDGVADVVNFAVVVDISEITVSLWTLERGANLPDDLVNTVGELVRRSSRLR